MVPFSKRYGRKALQISIFFNTKKIEKLFLFLFFIPLYSYSSHIVGGELNYKCLGGDQYEIRLRVYRDCYTAQAPFDDPAIVGIFDVNNVLKVSVDLKSPTISTLPPTVAQTNVCVQAPPNICVQVAEYVKVVTLPSLAGGYQLAYQRCCRNPTVNNITTPDNQGETYYAKIPDKAIVCNSNPVFKNWPPIFVCANNQIIFDHSATDNDGDVIVYSLCSPLGGASVNAPNPQPPTAPPYTPITWKAPYSPTNPLGGTNPLTIDPTTGIIKGIPQTIGQFVVGVCADEYRNGVLLGTTKRDFQFNVINCQPDVQALPPTLNVDCSTRKATFSNNGIGTNNFFWDFGVPGITSDTSRFKNPTYTYPSVGTYSVTLIAFSGINSKCNDTLKNFIVRIDPCPCTMTLGVSKVDAYCDNPFSGCVHISGSQSGTSSYSIDSYGTAAPPSKGGTCGSGGSSTLNLTATTTPASIIIKINGVTLPPPVSPAQTIVFTGQTQAACPRVANINCNGSGLASYDYYIWIPNGSSPGSATVTPSNGTGPYTYLWTPSGKTTATAGNLSTGTYTVTVTDVGNNCKKTSVVRIDDGSSMVLTTSQTPLSACAGSDATATVTANPAGDGPFTYLWSNGQTGSTATGLPKGIYTVVVRNRFGCESSSSVTIGQPILINVGINGTDAKCKGINGFITTNPSGGAGPYAYLWSTTPVQTDATASGLIAGTYSVTVTDAGGCTGTASVSIGNSSLTLTSSSADINCGGTMSGTASITATGGAPAYTYLWNSNPVQTTATATGLPGGIYIGKVVDSQGCADSIRFTITEPAPLGAEPSNTSTTSCAGVPNGSAHVDVNGGIPPFTYLWNSGQTTQDISGVPTGTYTITVTDSKGCTATKSIAVIPPAVLSLTTTASDITSCNGYKTGAVTVSPTGGKPGYTYLWNTNPVQTTQSANNLGAGVYIITVTDANGCSTSANVTINEPLPILLTTNSSLVGCISSNGSAGVTASGGTGSFTYLWSPSSKTDATITGLSVGNYKVTVTDINGCTNTTSVSVKKAPLPTSSIVSKNNINCKGNSTGSATVSGASGTPGYTYTWKPGGQTTPDNTGLTAGTYSVTVTDIYGCTVQQIVSITEPPSSITVIASSTDALCNNNNGTVTVSASGGTGTLLYSWTTPNNDVTSTVTGLTGGTYKVTVTDSNRCTQSAMVTVKNLPPPSIVISSKTDVTCYGFKDGTATISTSGGILPYTYDWNPSVTIPNNNTASNLSPDTYSVTVSDINGCTNTTKVTITEPLPFSITISSLSVLVCDGQPVTLIALPSGGTTPYNLIWFPSGPIVSPTSPSTYKVTGTDANGCISAADSITLTPLPVPIAGFDTLSISGFKPKYSFIDHSAASISWHWDFGDGSSSTLQNPYHIFPGAGTYTVMQIVTGESGCPDTITKIIVIRPFILIPNVFTPNGDGTNEEFWIPSSGFESFQLDIFDRWGIKLFSTNSGEIRWDGRTASGQPVPDGTYFYLLKAELKTDPEEKDVIKNYDTRGFFNLYGK